ncbi:Mediator of RNA polymerase II transcription subunit 17-like [Oopsacas minuta]|uniref:Mediator of RNA polymerase II transcription subunit 17-like n=1 Tax=Oopsacas minuta TaxID=111878 RepID=A0AAV7K5W5_9METZ|nr:Mediator of RNA polymerase II transcription subunit 17-like [Oopsacas minuta]
MSGNTGCPSNLISIEPLQRRLIQEFTWEAQEIYEEKLSLSEQLSRNVQRLEFSRDLDMGLFQSEEERLSEERDKTRNLAVGINQSKSEFVAPKESLRKALMEISVLSDVLEVNSDWLKFKRAYFR